MQKYTGRRKVVTDFERVTAANVRNAVSDVLGQHDKNSAEENFLFGYMRGIQPIYDRVKEIRPDIQYNTVVNHANEIVSFKSSYLLSSPITYVSRKDGAGVSTLVEKFNDFMHLSGKNATDKELADDLHICGLGYRMIYPNSAYNGDNSPFIITTLNPMTTFVAYRNSSAKNSEPVFAATYVNKTGVGRVYDVYTPESHFRMTDATIEEEPNPMGVIPIVEYVHNEFRLGAFEPVIDLLDDMNILESNRIEATAQNVQSLMWFNDIALDDDQVKALQNKPSAFIFTKTVKGGATPNIKSVMVDLQQADQQVLTNDLYKKILTIVGMPSTGDGNTSDSSNNGSTIVRNGWQHAEARAKETETLWARSDKRFVEAALSIARALVKDGFDLREDDITERFTRRNYEDISTRANVLTMLLGCDKVNPKQAYQVCGLFPDPEEAAIQGLDWYWEMEKKTVKEMTSGAGGRVEDAGDTGSGERRTDGGE